MLKKLAFVSMAAMLFLASAALAETALDTVLQVGTTQAFTDEAVPASDLETILQAGLSASSAMNQQPWFFVATTNQELMTELKGLMSFAPPAGAAGRPEGAPAEGNAAPMPAAGAKAGFGDSPAAILLYRDDATRSNNADFDCGLAAQNMVIAAASLGYGVKIVSSPTMVLNGDSHDAICETLGVDPSLQAVAVLLIGHTDESMDALSSATTREPMESKTRLIE